LASENADSARARLIKTRRGTQIDESLLPAARRECLDLLREVAREAVGEGTYLLGWISSASDSIDWDVEQLSMERIRRKPTPTEKKIASIATMVLATSRPVGLTRKKEGFVPFH
jgi:hypothetical protein